MPTSVRAFTLLGLAMLVAGCGGNSGGSGGSDGAKVRTVKLGDAITFKGANAKLDVKFAVTVEEGVIEDLKDFRLEDDEREMTPWYVTRTLENAGDTDLEADDAFMGIVSVRDDTGAEPKEIMPLGDFSNCELVNAPEPFKRGESFSTCDIYLVEDGRAVEEVVLEETRFEGDNLEYVWNVE